MVGVGSFIPFDHFLLNRSRRGSGACQLFPLSLVSLDYIPCFSTVGLLVPLLPDASPPYLFEFLSVEDLKRLQLQPESARFLEHVPPFSVHRGEDRFFPVGFSSH